MKNKIFASEGGIRHWLSALILSAAFAGTQAAYLSLGTGRHRLPPAAGAVLSFAAAFLFLLYLFNYCDRIDHSRPSDGRDQNAKAPGDRKKSLVLAATGLLLTWGIYYLMCFPGNITWDTGVSILYHLGIDRSNVNNPYFQNIIFGCAYQFGEALGNPKIGVAAFCTLQFLSYLAVLIYILPKVLRFFPAAGKALLALYALVPAFPIYALTMGKDSNFALAILVYVVLTLEMTGDPETFFAGRARPVILGISVLLIGLFRNKASTIPAAAILLFVLLAWRKKKAVIFAVTVCALTLFVCHILPPVLGVPKGNIKEALSIPMQQTAYYVRYYPDEVTEEERRAIEGVVPYNALDKYDPAISDPIKKQFKKEPTNQELAAYFGTWFAQMRKHPTAYLKAFYLQTYGYYTPAADRTDVKLHTFVGFRLKKVTYQKTKIKGNKNPLLKYVRELDDAVMHLPLYHYFSKIGLYFWLLVICVVRIFQTRRYRYLTCCAPALMIMIGCLFSPVNGYYRYAFSMILCTPILFVYIFLKKCEF